MAGYLVFGWLVDSVSVCINDVGDAITTTQNVHTQSLCPDSVDAATHTCVCVCVRALTCVLIIVPITRSPCGRPQSDSECPIAMAINVVSGD